MLNKIKNYFILFLIVLAFGVFVYYNAKVSHLQKVIDAKAPPDTIKIEIVQKDTSFVVSSDTIENIKVVHGDTIYMYKRFFGEFDQPLFHLGVWANSQTENFTFNIKYRSLKLFFEIKDKYDIRKGFKLHTEPDLGITYSVNWDQYTPLKKEKNFKLNLGGIYTKKFGPGIMGGLEIKKVSFGGVLFQDSYGGYLIWRF